MLDGVSGKLLEPGDERKRNGQALEGTGPEQEQPLLLDAGLRLMFRRRVPLLAGFGQHAGALADAEHVEDKGHAAIAHDGRAGIHSEPFQLLTQGLDHDFLGVVDAIDDEAKLPVLGLQDHHADRLGALRRFQPQHLIEVSNGQQGATPAIYRSTLHMLNVFILLFRGISLEADQLQQTDLGNDEPLPAAGDDEAGNDGQSKRDLELNGGAFTGPAEDVDNAADLLNMGLHDVHADAAAGNIGHALRRGEPGQEDEVESFAIAELLGLFGPQEPLLSGLLFDPRDVDSRAVVADFDVDLAAFVISAKG